MISWHSLFKSCSVPKNITELRKKIFWNRPPRASKAEQKSLVPTRQAEQTNQRRTPFTCTLWVPIHTNFNNQKGRPLSSLSVYYRVLQFLHMWGKMMTVSADGNWGISGGRGEVGVRVVLSWRKYPSWGKTVHVACKYLSRSLRETGRYTLYTCNSEPISGEKIYHPRWGEKLTMIPPDN